MNKRLKSQFSVTALLVGVNVVIFVLQWVFPSAEALLLAHGMLDTPAILQNGEWYRLVTSVFLHADPQHLSSNMIILYFLGVLVERALGGTSYLLLYLCAGIVGNLASLWMQLQEGSFYQSLGASGAVFGVVGAYLVLLLRNRRRIRRGDLMRVMFGVFYSLYIGFQSTGINNAAHVGGFCSGAIITLLLLLGRVA